ncbi:MAG: hypothetical protein OI74_05265 [Gammaproteobacteria bacterium (ex Lamellibrachia satsuma)]|nr:MAG: hypothetical protein HPY30_02990 [Gammaproteobacteria bacterium (ex Lamellibrachia satsuma)]RRS34616.1 MAG: hypothetical protein OI74_05265 [Gammaproteobacteria bacterium (ex Lamellibrachia satsuma)]RRS37392.1 MAG: hypothetical protein NV67_01040 [Gammaproteobacteria bacterium (ex Lamellibrachia satsuma)]
MIKSAPLRSLLSLFLILLLGLSLAGSITIITSEEVAADSYKKPNPPPKKVNKAKNTTTKTKSLSGIGKKATPIKTKAANKKANRKQITLLKKNTSKRSISDKSKLALESLRISKAKDKASHNSLRFGRQDMIYGLTNHGGLTKLINKHGGRRLDDIYGHPSQNQSWGAHSKNSMDQHIKSGGKIRFHLDGIKNNDMKNLLKNKGEWANATTSIELRYLRDNWPRFKNNVHFYKNGEHKEPPWKTLNSQ